MLLLLSRFSRVRPRATPINGSPPGSSINGIFQARVLEWGATAFTCIGRWVLYLWQVVLEVKNPPANAS